MTKEEFDALAQAALPTNDDWVSERELEDCSLKALSCTGQKDRWSPEETDDRSTLKRRSGEPPVRALLNARVQRA
jgi:hypothetical protein